MDSVEVKLFPTTLTEVETVFHCWYSGWKVITIFTSEEVHEISCDIAVGCEDAAVTRWSRRAWWAWRALDRPHIRGQRTATCIALQQALICKKVIKNRPCSHIKSFACLSSGFVSLTGPCTRMSFYVSVINRQHATIFWRFAEGRTLIFMDAKPGIGDMYH